jgi:hypothetical protein
VFAVHEVTVEAGFDVAVARLARLIQRGTLDGVSEAAYEDGLAAAMRAGPFGGPRGLSKLVQVRLLEPTAHGATLTVPLRWVAAGAAGELFPVLDADLVLARDGDDRTRLALAGSYRPPFGRAGAALDRAIMHRLATTTIRSLVESVAAAITHPRPSAAEAAPAGPAPAGSAPPGPAPGDNRGLT